MTIKEYLKEQNKKILDFARDECEQWNITAQKLTEVYFYNYIRLKKGIL